MRNSRQASAAPERLVVAGLVLTASMMIAETYQRWPLPLALAVTLAMLVVALVMVLTDAGSGPRGASGSRGTDLTGVSLKVVLALVAIAVIKGAVAALRSEWVVTVGWAVLAVGLIFGCVRLTRNGNKAADAGVACPRTQGDT